GELLYRRRTVDPSPTVTQEMSSLRSLRLCERLVFAPSLKIVSRKGAKIAKKTSRIKRCASGAAGSVFAFHLLFGGELLYRRRTVDPSPTVTQEMSSLRSLRLCERLVFAPS